VAKVNISIDDVCPHPHSSVKVLERCFELIEIFPTIKFTLFVPIAYWRTIGNTATRQPCFIHEDPQFCQVIRELPAENYEIGSHGYYHGIPGETNNDEFKLLSHSDTVNKFHLIYAGIKHAQLENIFKPIFRPPAWKMSPEAIRAAFDEGIEILALSPDHKEIYLKEDENYDKVVYYNVCPPLKPLKLFDKTEIVYHACEWDQNYLNGSHTNQLKEFLLKNKENIEFCFMEEMI
jgi:hypothetical protein